MPAKANKTAQYQLAYAQPEKYAPMINGMARILKNVKQLGMFIIV
jgi:hypothetical protein